MESSITEALEKAISQTVADFRNSADKIHNERDLHWILYHNLRQVFQGEHPIDVIRAEFPTSRIYREKNPNNPSRGHYDLVIVDQEGRIAVAVEIKLWRTRPLKNLNELIKWDTGKLKDPENKVANPYVLNFVTLDLSREAMKKFYKCLKKKLSEELSTQSRLKIVCVTPNASPEWISKT